MPYLSFDLDALDALPDVARAAGISEAEVAYGLLRLWRHAWHGKTELVTFTHLAGFFPGDADRVRGALDAFGFVACTNANTVRVRGAERYLRISAARSKGGKAAAGNLRNSRSPAKAQPEVQPNSSSAQAEHKLGTSSGSASALTPSTEHRTPNRNTHSAQSLDERLCAAFFEIRKASYLWDSKRDGEGLRRILSMRPSPSEADIEAKWRTAVGLPEKAFARCSTVAELARKWNDIPAPTPKADEPAWIDYDGVSDLYGGDAA